MNLARTPFIRGVVVIGGGAAIAQAVPIVATPLLTRLYAPEAFGLLGLFVAFLRFAQPAISLDYPKAIVSARNDEEASDLTLLSGVAILPITVVSCLVLWLLKTNDWMGFGALPVLAIPLVALSLIFTGAYWTCRYWMLRFGEYRTVSEAIVAQSIGRTIAQFALAFVASGWGGLVIGSTAGVGLGLRQMWVQTWPRVQELSLPWNPLRLKQVAREYRKFPLVSMPSSVLNSLATALPVPLITAAYGVAVAGQYSVTMRILLVPLSLVGASVGDVFHHHIARMERERPSHAFRFFLRVSGGLFLLGLLPMAIIALFGEQLWSIALGSTWSQAGQMATALTPWALVQLVVSPLSRIVQVYQRQELKLVYDILGLLSIAGTLSLGPLLNWPILTTITVLGISQALVYGIYFLLLANIVRVSIHRAS